MNIEIKGNSFIENMMIAVSYSKIGSRTSNPSSLKIKIYRILDAIFSALSSSYQIKRMEISHKVMRIHAQSNIPQEKVIVQVKSTSKVAQNILPKAELEKPPAKKRQTEASEYEKEMQEHVQQLRRLNPEDLFNTNPDLEEAAQDYEFSHDLSAHIARTAAFVGVVTALASMQKEAAAAEASGDLKEAQEP